VIYRRSPAQAQRFLLRVTAAGASTLLGIVACRSEVAGFSEGGTGFPDGGTGDDGQYSSGSPGLGCGRGGVCGSTGSPDNFPGSSGSGAQDVNLPDVSETGADIPEDGIADREGVGADAQDDVTDAGSDTADGQRDP
jgi:hypothetical protein